MANAKTETCTTKVPCMGKKIALISWIIFSVGYIGYKTKVDIMDIAFNKGQMSGAQRGYEAAVVDLMKQAQNKDCKAFGVHIGEGEQKVEVGLMNVECLQQAPAAQGPNTQAPMPVVQDPVISE